MPLGRDLRSPPRGKYSRLNLGDNVYNPRTFKRNMDFEMSDISRVTSVMSFATPSVELNKYHIQPAKEEESKKKHTERYEMVVATVKQPGKRAQPAQKHT
jgi:hypothetical protein